MNKLELIERLKDVSDDEEIAFVLFDDKDYEFRWLTPSGNWNSDPSQVLAFTINGYMPKAPTTKEIDAQLAQIKVGEKSDIVEDAVNSTLELNVRYPEITVQLTGEDGNAFSILGIVNRALNNAHVSKLEMQLFSKEAMSGDYDHLLQTVMMWVTVV